MTVIASERRPSASARRPRSRVQRLAFLIAIALCSPSIIAADSPKPAPTPQLSTLPSGLEIPSYAPGPIPFHQGEQLVFAASWLGIPAAQARIVLSGDRKQPRMWNGEVWVRTSPGVDILYKLRTYLREGFAGKSIAPREVYISQHENQRVSEYQLTFDRAAEVVTAIKRTRKGTATSRFRAGNPSGPVSAAIMALSQPLRPGLKLVFDVFSGRSRYVIKFAVAGRERIATPLGEFDAWRVVPTMVWLNDDDSRKTARETTVWISADARRLPLRVEVTAFIGKLRADLVQVGDATQSAEDQRPPD